MEHLYITEMISKNSARFVIRHVMLQLFSMFKLKPADRKPCLTAISESLILDKDCLQVFEDVRKKGKNADFNRVFSHTKIKEKMREFKQMDTTLINIDNYTKKFEEYPSDLVVFAKEQNIKLISLTSMRGQALALMAQPEVRGQRHITREEANKFFKNIGMHTDDAIQQFNKATGLKRMKINKSYCLQYPFESDKIHLDKRNGVFITGDKDTQVNAIKDWYKANVIDVPNNEWQIGHLDPTIGDSSEKNLAFQPPIQARYRNRFKFDNYFMIKCPTASELIPKMNTYYTEEEQKEIYEALKQKFQK